MYEIDIENLVKKIITERFSQDDDSNKIIHNSLSTIFEALYDYTRNVNQKLVDNAYMQEDCCLIRDVYTVLLPITLPDEYESVGLYQMADVTPFRVFLDCEYDDVRSFGGDLPEEEKTYEGRYVDKKDRETGSFKYHLEFDGSFLKAQEILFDFAEFFCVKNPVVLSPYSRKSFFVRLIDEDEGLLKDKNKELDFCFAENHIPVIMGENCLYWNIKQYIENEKTYDAKDPYGDTTKFIYRFRKTRKGNIPLPLPLSNQTHIYSINVTEIGVDITTNREVDDFIVYEYVDFDLNSGLAKERQSKQLLFSNETIDGTEKRRRLLSEGDIERATCCCFRGWRDVRCERSEGGGSIIPRYSKKYRLDRKAKNMFNTIRKEYISFKGVENKKFLTDFANYVLEYLEYYYPEIEWVGEE